VGARHLAHDGGVPPSRVTVGTHSVALALLATLLAAAACGASKGDSSHAAGPGLSCPGAVPTDGTPCDRPITCAFAGADPQGVCGPQAICALVPGAVYKWRVTPASSTCGTNPRPCPAAFADVTVGSACEGIPDGGAVDFLCDYAEGRCGCVPCFAANGGLGAKWSCRAWDAGATDPSCPAKAPLAGTACDASDASHAICFYAGCGQVPIGDNLQCVGGIWQLRGIGGTCAFPNCSMM
jgi:hypothetical protein